MAKLISTDTNEIFLRTTEMNLGRHYPSVSHHCIVADARDLRVETIRAHCCGPLSIVFGGPPCEDFTRYGQRRGMNGQKGPLIYEFSRLVADLRPDVFLFENVPYLLKVAADGFSQMLSFFRRCGFHSKWQKLAAADYGAPTLRERIFVVGFRNAAACDRFTFPSPTHSGDQSPDLFCPITGFRPWVTVGDVLRDVPSPSDPSANRYLNHNARKHRPATIEGFRAIKPGEWARGSYRYRAPWDGLCSSLTAGLDDSTKSHLHPIEHREMTVREYARIHGFPDTWFFAGTNENGAKQVANAVPTPLGKNYLEAFARL